MIVIENKYLINESHDVRVNRDQVAWTQITDGGREGTLLLRVYFPSGRSLKLAIREADVDQVLGLFV